MAIDEIIDEIRANRDAHAAKLNYDLRAIYEDLKKSEIERINTGHPFVYRLSRNEQMSYNRSLQRTSGPLSLRSGTAELGRWSVAR